MARILALFPGQGSQQVGMGRNFWEEDPESRTLFESADTALGFSLSKLCFEGPLEELTLTKYAQPAILLVSVAAFRAAKISPTAAAGHSLGEYSALVAAGSLRFEDAIRLVHRRGQYMQEAVPPGAGKMVAVMGPSEAEIADVIAAVPHGIKEIANLNCPGQTVVAGDVAGIDAFSVAMQAQGAKIIPLNVSAPFHCALMAPAAERLAADLDATTFENPTFPVYSNVSARGIISGDEARELLKKQVCATVRWTDSMLHAIEECGITHSVEFGAGGVLSKLLKRIHGGTPRFEFDSPEKRKELADLAAA